MGGRKYNYEETQTIRDLAYIMAAGEGPFTKRMLVEKLSEFYPERYHQELMNEISTAILIDKGCNNRFISVKQGWWDLRERL